MKKLLCIILSVLMLLTCFTACATTGGEGGNTTAGADTTAPDTTAADTTAGGTTGGSDTPAVPNENHVALADLGNYKVIFSGDELGSARPLANGLVTELNKLNLDKTLSASADTHFDNRTPVDCEILIGNTDRIETRAFKQTLRAQDYGYGLINKKIVIYGYTTENLSKAIELFVEDRLTQRALADNIVIKESEGYVVEGDYDVRVLKLHDRDISECIFVYPKKSADAKLIAEDLAAYIFKNFEFFVPVIADDTARAEGSYEILIGATNRAETVPSDLTSDECYITTDETATLVSGGGDVGLYHAFTSFKTLLNPDMGVRDIEINLDEPLRQKAKEAAVKSMSFNVWVGGSDINGDRVLQIIRLYDPDVLGVQEASVAWMNILKDGLSDTYSCVGRGREVNGGEHCAIFYRTSMFDLLTSDTKWLSDTPNVAGSRLPESQFIRIVTYAVLRRKSDGKILVHVNTHLDTVNSTVRNQQIKILLNLINEISYVKNGATVIMTGDFNDVPNSSFYNTLMQNGYSDSQTIAEKVTSTSHTYKASAEESASLTIDFHFINTKLSAVLKYHVCTDQIEGDVPSDHYPVYIEYLLN